MSLYADAKFPVSPVIETLHRDELRSFATAGTWGSAAQRTAIAATARKVLCDADLQESVGDEALAQSVQLPAAAVRLASAVASGASEVDRAFCKQVQAEGVTEGAYVEIVSLVSRLSNLDVFARGLGMPPRQLLEPLDDKAPTFSRPSEAINEGFFTASVPNAPAGGAIAESLYGKSPAGNFVRAVSLVPDEARRVIALVSNQYFPTEHILDFSPGSSHALSRPQIELVAAKVSEHNRCFY